MRIFNTDKTEEIKVYDADNGCLRPDRLFLAHHEATEATEGEYHLELIAEYPNGGKSYKEVCDKEPRGAQPAYDEYEDIMVFVEFTEAQRAEREIVKLKTRLSETDYQAIKYAEGVISEEDYAPVKTERIKWRERINELEKLLKKGE